MGPELLTYIAKAERVWLIVSLAVFVAGMLVTLFAAQYWETLESLFYLLLGLSTGTWGTYRAIYRLTTKENKK